MADGTYTAMAKRLRKDSPPTAGQLWSYRSLCARDGLDRDGHHRYVKLVHELIHTECIGLSEGRGHYGDHPHAGDRDWAIQRIRELWSEIGELLGVGPPPWLEAVDLHLRRLAS